MQRIISARFFFFFLQIKATDNGRPQKSATARLHIEWVRRPPAAALPLLFDESFYNFTVMENDKVAEIVGVVTLQLTDAPLWFDIAGKNPPVGSAGGASPGLVHGVVGSHRRCLLVFFEVQLRFVASLHDLCCFAHPRLHGNSLSSCWVCMPCGM